jgi:hypothetical protein
MKKLLLSAVASLTLVGAASAQVNTVPQVGLTTGYLPKVTYSAIWVGLVPAASATDVVCISGSSSRTVRLDSISISGTATAAINLPATILRRVALDSGGTAGTTTANPANTIGKRDLNFPTATATLISYTANPTINDSSPTYIDSQYVNIATAATLGSASIFNFARDIENQLQVPTIAAGSTAVQICLNLNGTSIGAGGTTTGSVVWTEE